MAEPKGILSRNIKLGWSNSTASTYTYTPLTGLQEIPDIGKGEPDTVETTTLAQGTRTYITGLKNVGDSLEFTFLYDEAQFSALNGSTFAGKDIHWAVIMPDGTGSTGDNPVYKTVFKFNGEGNTTLAGVGVGDALTYTLAITPSTQISIASDGATVLGS